MLTGALYTLVPAGRWRRRGGWAALAIVVVIGLSRMRLGVDTPADLLLGAILGVTVPLLGMRLFAPEESFPVVYGGAHGAHQAVPSASTSARSSSSPRRRSQRRSPRPTASRCRPSSGTRSGPVAASCTRSSFGCCRAGLRPSGSSAGARAGWRPQPPSSRRSSCSASPWRMCWSTKPPGHRPCSSPIWAARPWNRCWPRPSRCPPLPKWRASGRCPPAGAWAGSRRSAVHRSSRWDNDRAGRGALQLTLTGHCAVGPAAAVQTAEPGISRLRALVGGPRFAATWYDVFPGGCVQIALRPDTQQATADQNLAGQVPAIIGYVSRAALRHDLAQRSGGWLRLN